MNLKQARLHAGLSQRALGARIGVDQPTISRIECGHRAITVTQLLAISRVLAIPLSQLLPEDVAETGKAA